MIGGCGIPITHDSKPYLHNSQNYGVTSLETLLLFAFLLFLSFPLHPILLYYFS